jgi:hypothetical protein
MKKIITLALMALSTASFSQIIVLSISGNVSINGSAASNELIEVFVNQTTPNQDSLFFIAYTDSLGDYVISEELDVLSDGSLSVVWNDCNGNMISRENQYSATNATFSESYTCTSNQNLYVNLFTRTNSNATPGQSVKIVVDSNEPTIVDEGVTDSIGVYSASYNFRHVAYGNATLSWIDDCNGDTVTQSLAFNTQGIMQIGHEFNCAITYPGGVIVYGSVTEDGNSVNNGNILVKLYDEGNTLVATKTEAIVNGAYETLIEASGDYTGRVESSWLDACDSTLWKSELVYIPSDSVVSVNHSFSCWNDSTTTNQDTTAIYIHGYVTVDDDVSYPDVVNVGVYSLNNETMLFEDVYTNINGVYGIYTYVASDFSGYVRTEWFDPCGNVYKVTETSIAPTTTLSVDIIHNYTCNASTEQTIFGDVYENDSLLVDLADVYLYLREPTTNNYMVVDTFNITPNYFGRYEFVVNHGNEYLVKAKAIQNPDYLPTYHHSAINWEGADIITAINNSTPRNVMLIASAEANGQGSVSGNVAEEERGGLSYFMMTAVITDESNNALYTTDIDNFGDFAFAGLPNGVYRLLIDYIGYGSDYITIRIDDENQTVDNLRFEVGEQSVSSDIKEMQANKLVRIYPNPAVDEITLVLATPNATVSIQDGLGRNVYQVVIKNQIETSIDISALSKGTYYLLVSTANGVDAQQLIKW